MYTMAFAMQTSVFQPRLRATRAARSRVVVRASAEERSQSVANAAVVGALVLSLGSAPAFAATVRRCAPVLPGRPSAHREGPRGAQWAPIGAPTCGICCGRTVCRRGRRGCRDRWIVPSTSLQASCRGAATTPQATETDIAAVKASFEKRCGPGADACLRQAGSK